MSHPSLSVFENEVLFPNRAVDEEYLDEQLGLLTGFWAEGDLSKIIEQVEQLITQEIYDIRFTSYYFYGLWVTSKDCALVEVLESILNLLKQKSEVWLPVETSPEMADVSADISQEGLNLMQACFGMLFKRINKRLGRFASDEETEEADPCQIIELCGQLSGVLTSDYGLVGVSGHLTEISRFHEDACREETPDEESDDAPDVGNTEEEGDTKSQEETVVELATPDPQLIAEADKETNHSYSLQALLNKIQIFENLMQKEELYKAAIVYEEIQYELNNFNPIKYFPKLFSQFAGVRALHSGQLAELVKHNETVQWQALKEYFIADPEGYQQLPVDTESLLAESEVTREPESQYQNDSSDEFDYD